MFQSGRPVEVLERLLTVRGGKRFVRAYTAYFHNLRVLTPCPVPPTGGAIIVCNHTSSLDPILLQAACPRLITWMMAKEYGSIFGCKWFFRAIEPILVERSGRDMAATRAALRALEAGKILGIFPEGRIEPTRELMEFQAGVGMLALKTNAPVFPAYVDGSQRGKGMAEVFVRPNQITLAFGPAVELDRTIEGRAGIEDATLRIRWAIERLEKQGQS